MGNIAPSGVLYLSRNCHQEQLLSYKQNGSALKGGGHGKIYSEFIV